MDVRVFKSAQRAAWSAADTLLQTVRDTPSMVISLPTGRTPLPLYEDLVRRGGAGLFSRVVFFQMDEFVGVEQHDPGSLAAYLHQYVFDPLRLDPQNIHLLNGTAVDLPGECFRYERTLAGCGGLDLIVLGIGTNGHVGFNEPSDTLAGPTHVTELQPSTRHDSEWLFGGRAEAVPLQALTMGIATILRATRILLLATGESKAACLRQALYGPIATQVPASLLQAHRAVEVYLDRGAASLLREPVLAE
jgi:glucosamine-6-phosphate deaminase